MDSIADILSYLSEPDPHSRTERILVGFRADPGDGSFCRHPFLGFLRKRELHSQTCPYREWRLAFNKSSPAADTPCSTFKSRPLWTIVANPECERNSRFRPDFLLNRHLTVGENLINDEVPGQLPITSPLTQQDDNFTCRVKFNDFALVPKARKRVLHNPPSQMRTRQV